MFTPCSSVSIVNLEHVLAGWVTRYKNELLTKPKRFNDFVFIIITAEVPDFAES